MAIINRIADSLIERMGLVKKADMDIMFPSSYGFGQQSGASTRTYEFLTRGEVKELKEKMAMKVSWIFSDVEMLANLFGSVRFEMFTGARTLNPIDDKPILEHPFLDVISRPNKFMGLSYLLRYSCLWLLLRGEVYWWLIRDKKGDLVEIWPLPSDHLRPHSHPKDYIDYFLYAPDVNREPIPIPVEDIFYVHTPNVFDYHRGSTALDSILHQASTDLEAVKWNKDTFTQEASIKTLISLPAEMQRRLYERAKEEIMQELTQNKRRYMVAKSGAIDIKQIGLTPKEMEYIAGREFTQKEIDRIFGIPAGFWSETANRANADAAKEVVFDIKLWPLIVLLVDEINAQIISRIYKDEDIKVKAQDIRPKRIDEEIRVNEHEFQVMTVNEVRIKFGLKKFPSDFGDLPWALRTNAKAIEVHLGQKEEGAPAEQPAQTQEEPVKPAEAEQATEEPAATEEEPKEQEAGAKEEKKNLFLPIAINKTLNQWQSIAERQVERDGKVTYNFVTPYGRHIDGQIYTMLAYCKNQAQVRETFKLVKSSLAEENDIKSLNPYVDNTTVNGMIDKFINTMVGYAALTSTTGLNVLIRTMLFKTIVNIVNIGRGETPTTGLGSDLSHQLQDTINANNLTSERLAEDIISGVYKNNEQSLLNRVSLIATAVAGVYWLGKVNKLDTVYIWSASDNGDSCSTCIGLDGQEFTATQLKEKGLYPRTKNGLLECGGWHCNCKLKEK